MTDEPTQVEYEFGARLGKWRQSQLHSAGVPFEVRYDGGMVYLMIPVSYEQRAVRAFEPAPWRSELKRWRRRLRGDRRPGRLQRVDLR